MCFKANEKVLAIGDNLRTDIKGANNLNKDCLFISNGVHRNEFSNNLELEKLLINIKLKLIIFKKNFNGKMKIYKNANLNKKHQNGVIAIGNFDGLHLGHQKVINEAKKKARKNKLPFGIMTFEPVPVMFFNSNIKNHRINS